MRLCHWGQTTYRAGVSTLPLAAVGCTRREASIALAANHAVAVVLASEHLQRRLDDTTAKTEHQMESRLCLTS